MTNRAVGLPPTSSPVFLHSTAQLLAVNTFFCAWPHPGPGDERRVTGAVRVSQVHEGSRWGQRAQQVKGQARCGERLEGAEPENRGGEAGPQGVGVVGTMRLACVSAA